MPLPKVAIISTGGTIQNGQPFVTSNKAGGTSNILRAQRLHEPVTIKIAKEDIDGNPLEAPSGTEPYWSVTLEPEDGLYLLPYMEPGHSPIPGYPPARISIRRLAEEIDRFGLDTTGQNNLIASTADLVIRMIIDPETGEELRAGGETFALRELVLIANAVNDALSQEDIVACVVTHGTFTVEETACFLNYTVGNDKPVVLCSSQRRHTSVGNEGDWNLVDGVRVAVCPDSRGKGVVMVMNEQILPAREVTKTNQRPDGFMSSGGSAGALGSIESDQVTYYFGPTRKHTLTSEVRIQGPIPTSLPKVDIVKTYAGADGILIEALVQQALTERSATDRTHKHGIVVEGFAYSGVPHRFQRPALEQAVTEHGIPVALANRGDHGRIPRSPDSIFITCDNLLAVKARLLLTLAIEKLGMLTPYLDANKPTDVEKQRLLQGVQRYQEIFDTH